MATQASREAAAALAAIMEPHEVEGAMLVGGVAVLEYVAPDGRRWLSRIGMGDPVGGRCPTWQQNGYLHEALYGDWPS